ncbi:MAG: succinylglutamate desuccinylase/aspartoacylase family protein [Myxococcota bacterium]
MGPNTVRRFAALALGSLALGAAQARAQALELLGQPIAPGDQRRLALPVSETFVGEDASTPVIVVAGAQVGPVLCLTAGIHGDELNGIEVVRRSLDRAKPDTLAGTLVGIPIVNLAAFRRSSRYMPDRRDLNRFFPGRPRGSSASRLAYSVFEKVVRQCDALVDVHSGSFHRTNLPQVRGDLRRPEVLRLARAFGSEIAIHNEGRAGTLRRAASEAGIPAITYEAGEPMRFQSDEIERGVLGVEHMLAQLGMRLVKTSGAPEPQLYYRARWIRADDGGILKARAKLGDTVKANQVLGTIFDPISNEKSTIRATHEGRVIGVALDQLVMPGFAAFHIATDEPMEDGAVVPAAALPSVDEGAEPGRSELEERPD